MRWATPRAPRSWRGLALSPITPSAFPLAFPEAGINEDTIAAALASYERTLIAANSRFDRWFLAGESSALTAVERSGLELFRGKAGCAACHHFSERDAVFTDHRFHNTGVGWARANAANRTVSVPLGGGETAEVSAAEMTALFGGDLRDDGRFEVTRQPRDRWAYKTPSLRNVALTAPYMHDGSLATLSEVIEFYDRGGDRQSGQGSPGAAVAPESGGEAGVGGIPAYADWRQRRSTRCGGAGGIP